MHNTKPSKWILITNTHHAGTKWLGTLLASDRAVAYRQNRVSLCEGGSVYARTVAQVAFLPGLETIESHPHKHPVADHFKHLEANVRADVYVQSDAWHVGYFLTDLATWPAQIDSLREHRFKVRNIAMNPIRVLDAMHRMLLMYANRGVALPPLVVEPGLYEYLRPDQITTDSDDDLFLRAALHLANALARDATLAHRFGIASMTFENLFSDRTYLLRETADLSGGRIAMSPAKLDQFLAPQGAHALRNHESLANLPQPPEAPARNIHAEAESYYRGLDEWKRRMLTAVYSAYDIFDLYRRFGYRFDYLESPGDTGIAEFPTAGLAYRWPDVTLSQDAQAFLAEASANQPLAGEAAGGR